MSPTLERDDLGDAQSGAIGGGGRRLYQFRNVPVVEKHGSLMRFGNRREPVFFGADDYQLYRQLIATAARRAGAAIWAYCLMPNHVHLIVTPSGRDGLRASFAEAHRRYTGAINARFRWTGHLFQPLRRGGDGRAAHLLAATRYIALNPVAAGLVSRAEDWPWSSARAHLAVADDELATVAPFAR